MSRPTKQQLSDMLRESVRTPSSLKPVIVIFGPTASGKTDLGVKIFGNRGGFPCGDFFSGLGEVISADSMQVYTGMDIGTAKPDRETLEILPHHLIDLIPPSQQYCAGDFVRMADEKVVEILSRGKFPVILGGTAFYIKNFIFGLPETPSCDPEIRKKLKDRLEKDGAEALYNELLISDPVSAGKIHKNDHYRILRALEILEATGKSQHSFALNNIERKGFKFFVYGLDVERNLLYSRIDNRIHSMEEKGLAREFYNLVSSGFTESSPGMNAIGYNEFFKIRDGVNNLRLPSGLKEEDRVFMQEYSEKIKKGGCNPVNFPLTSGLEKAVFSLISHDTKRYAKRQLIFFKTIKTVKWINPFNPRDFFNSLLESVLDFFYQEVHNG